MAAASACSLDVIRYVPEARLSVWYCGSVPMSRRPSARRRFRVWGWLGGSGLCPFFRRSDPLVLTEVSVSVTGSYGFRFRIVGHTRCLGSLPREGVSGTEGGWVVTVLAGYSPDLVFRYVPEALLSDRKLRLPVGYRRSAPTCRRPSVGRFYRKARGGCGQAEAGTSCVPFVLPGVTYRRHGFPTSGCRIVILPAVAGTFRVKGLPLCG